MTHVRSLLALILASCVESVEPQPDAAVEPVALDACVREPSDGCCSLLPDESAVRQCVIDEQGDIKGCGVAVCWRADCTLQRVNFCNY